MKRLIQILLSTVLVTVAGSNALAQYIAADSGNGSVYYQFDVTRSYYAEGPPDNEYATIPPSGSALLDIGFRRDTTHGWLPIEPKSKIIVYGATPPGVTDPGLEVHFFELAKDFSILAVSGAFFVYPGATTIHVPDTQYTYVEFTVTGGGTDTGSQGMNIDAVTLFQDFSTLSVDQEILPSAAGLLSNYPNPFIAGRSTNLRYHLNNPGIATLIVYDVMGREASRTELGYLNQGDYMTRFTSPHSGVYFAELVVGGKPLGNILKLTSIR